MFNVKKYETIHLRSFYLPSYFVANRAPEIPNCDQKTYMFGYKGQSQYHSFILQSIIRNYRSIYKCLVKKYVKYFVFFSFYP